MRGHDADHGILYINIICKGVGIQCHPVFTIVCCIRQYSIPPPVCRHPRLVFNARIRCTWCTDKNQRISQRLAQCQTIGMCQNTATQPIIQLPVTPTVTVSCTGITVSPSVIQRGISCFTAPLIPSPGITTLDAVSQIIVPQQCAIQPCCTGSLSVSLQGLTVTGTGVSPCRCAVRTHPVAERNADIK
ncbi:hypothetical protein HmCmsJML212_04759 [Escherichia coli]|nr:hypothetical protein HmCmsJML212_04759 [Escherichia coli]